MKPQHRHTGSQLAELPEAQFPDKINEKHLKSLYAKKMRSPNRDSEGKLQTDQTFTSSKDDLLSPSGEVPQMQTIYGGAQIMRVTTRSKKSQLQEFQKQSENDQELSNTIKRLLFQFQTYKQDK